ncbi:MAG: hypothetical protein ABS999_17070 [Pseudomonas atacamensis]|uniref:hypothetical protein n=1 Tax=Pseudomonas atacamensis TaxID=2565368 RepID=UPI0033145EB5
MNLLFKSIILSFMLTAPLAYAAAPVQTPSQSVPKVETAQHTKNEENKPEAVAELKAEIKILKAQNKLIRDYQGSMSDTVFWALTLITGIFAILISYSLFTNLRFYDQDKARLKSELESTINKFKSDLLVKFEQDKNDLEKSFETRNEANMKIVLDQGAEGRGRVDAIRTELQEKIDLILVKIEIHDKKFAAISKRASQIEYEIRAVEEHVWELKDIPDCILLTQFQGLRASKDADYEYATGSVLKRMAETLEKHYIKKNRVLKPDMITRIEESLVSVNDPDIQTIQKIRQALESVPKEEPASLAAAADVGEVP